MKYRFPVSALLLSFLFAQTSDARRGSLDRKPGFFGFTRACIEDWDQGHEILGGCVTMFIPLVLGDSFTAPIQSLIKITEYMERSSNEPSSSDKKSTSSTGDNKSTSESSTKKDQAGETPEERKVIQKLSLFIHVADDARTYLLDRTSSPLLESAVKAIRYFDSQGDDVNPEYTVESEKILSLETELLQALNSMGFK
jgi:hypothetical protein